MNSKNQHFHLKVIDIKNILPHEEYDSSRALPLVESLQKIKKLINPILVTHLIGDSYVQLDGMNRYSAVKKLKIQSILTQVLDYNDQDSVDLSTWCHLNKIRKKDFLEKVAKIENLQIKEVSEKYLRRRYINDEGEGYLCTIVFRDNTIYRCSTGGKLVQKVKTLNAIVDIYKKNITRDILPDDADLEDVVGIFSRYRESETVVIFPTFTRHQILKIVKYRVLFPGGVTRFIIKRRCLNIHYPLQNLKGKQSEKEKNEILEQYLNKMSYRLYEEPTIYFES